MLTLLFDIDGTLLRTRGAGLSAIHKTMQEMFGISSALPRVSVHGRTDCGILSEIFAPFGLDFTEHRRVFLEKYCQHLRHALPDFEGHVLPGVFSLLEEIHSRPDVTLGLLTGNCEQAAQIKIEHFGLRQYFCGLGGYGDRAANRSDVARDALRAVQQHVGVAFDSEKLWVIGDTVDDISCGRAIDAKVLVVETGGCDIGELQTKNPDVALTDLSDVDGVLRHWDLA